MRKGNLIYLESRRFKERREAIKFAENEYNQALEEQRIIREAYSRSTYRPAPLSFQDKMVDILRERIIKLKKSKCTCNN